MGCFLDKLRGEGEVGAEDGVVFVPDLGEGAGVLVQCVVDPLFVLKGRGSVACLNRTMQ